MTRKQFDAVQVLFKVLLIEQNTKLELQKTLAACKVLKLTSLQTETILIQFQFGQLIEDKFQYYAEFC